MHPPQVALDEPGEVMPERAQQPHPQPNPKPPYWSMLLPQQSSVAVWSSACLTICPLIISQIEMACQKTMIWFPETPNVCTWFSEVIVPWVDLGYNPALVSAWHDAVAKDAHSPLDLRTLEPGFTWAHIKPGNKHAEPNILIAWAYLEDILVSQLLVLAIAFRWPKRVQHASISSRTTPVL